MFKPMLAATLKHPRDLIYPQLVSPKLDGIRCLIHEGQAVSRNLKPIRNRFVQEMLSTLPEGLDGELIVGSPTQGNVLNRTTSGIMSAYGEPDFKFHVFDRFDLLAPFHTRITMAHQFTHTFIEPVKHHLVESVLEFERKENEYLEEGYEGIMARSPHGQYKHGRATNQEQLLHKYKQFTDSELFITGVLEGQRNENAQTRDALGGAERSTMQAGMVRSGMVGTIIGNDVKTGQALEISPGRMTHDMRQYYWEHQDQIVGRVATYKFFGYGNVSAPRFATWQCFRELGT